VQIRAADTTHPHADENLPRTWDGHLVVATSQGIGFHRSGSMEHTGLHPSSMLPDSSAIWPDKVF
jgi:hypothetical protein